MFLPYYIHICISSISIYPKKTSKKTQKISHVPNWNIFPSSSYGPFIVTPKSAFVQELLVGEGSGTEAASIKWHRWVVNRRVNRRNDLRFFLVNMFEKNNYIFTTIKYLINLCSPGILSRKIKLRTKTHFTLPFFARNSKIHSNSNNSATWIYVRKFPFTTYTAYDLFCHFFGFKVMHGYMICLG